jgi:hypothetical protein
MRRAKRSRLGPAWWGALVVGCAGVIATYLLYRSAPSTTTGQLDGLGRRIETLQARAEALEQLQAALTPPAEEEWLPTYRIECPPQWREMGPIGQGLWGCQAPDPLPNGFHPNCNLTSSPVEAGVTAQSYYEAASRSPQLATARQLGGRAVRLRHQAAYEGSFEHQLGGAPLRVLATVVVLEQRSFAVTCSAPVPSFDQFDTIFRQIAASFDLGA